MAEGKRVALVTGGAKGIGRLALGATPRGLDGAAGLASIRVTRSSTRYAYCVTGGGRLTAVFGKGAKVELVASSVAARGFGGVRPGTAVSSAKRRFTHLRRVSASVYRFGPRSRRILGVGNGKVRFVGVASARVARSSALLRRYAARAR